MLKTSNALSIFFTISSARALDLAQNEAVSQLHQVAQHLRGIKLSFPLAVVDTTVELVPAKVGSQDIVALHMTTAQQLSQSQLLELAHKVMYLTTMSSSQDCHLSALKIDDHVNV